MTASKIIDKAILLLGYDTLKNTGSISGFEHAALTALNIVYADMSNNTIEEKERLLDLWKY